MVRSGLVLTDQKMVTRQIAINWLEKASCTHIVMQMLPSVHPQGSIGLVVLMILLGVASYFKAKRREYSGKFNFNIRILGRMNKTFFLENSQILNIP